MDILNNGWKILRFRATTHGIVYLLKLTDLYCVVVEDTNEVPIYTYTSFDRLLASKDYNEQKQRLFKGELNEKDFS